VNSDCGAKALAFDRIQVDALVRMATAAAGMVEAGLASNSEPASRKKESRIECGVVGHLVR
jgi:hypothetical protein